MNGTSFHPSAIEERLRAGPAPDPQGWRRTTDALTRRAEAAGLVDVAFARHDSPLGAILVAGTRDGLVRIGLPAEGEDAVLDDLARRVSGRLLAGQHRTVDEARRQLDEYFERRRTAFEVPLDWRLTQGFRRRVLTATAEIPYGQTASYAQVALRAGSPRAVRAAGTALARNPLPIIVPCHRVLRSSGELGTYRGGTDAKARLIALEAAGRGPGALAAPRR